VEPMVAPLAVVPHFWAFDYLPFLQRSLFPLRLDFEAPVYFALEERQRNWQSAQFRHTTLDNCYWYLELMG